MYCYPPNWNIGTYCGVQKKTKGQLAKGVNLDSRKIRPDVYQKIKLKERNYLCSCFLVNLI
jgi:hypothetical protein